MSKINSRKKSREKRFLKKFEAIDIPIKLLKSQIWAKKEKEIEKERKRKKEEMVNRC